MFAQSVTHSWGMRYRGCVVMEEMRLLTYEISHKSNIWQMIQSKLIQLVSLSPHSGNVSPKCQMQSYSFQCFTQKPLFISKNTLLWEQWWESSQKISANNTNESSPDRYQQSWLRWYQRLRQMIDRHSNSHSQYCFSEIWIESFQWVLFPLKFPQSVR